MEGGGEGVEVIAATTNASFECASVLVGNDKEHQEIANFDANTLLEEQTEWRTISQRFPCTISPGATCSVLPCAGGPDKDTGMYDEENNDRVLFIGGKSASNRGLYLDVLVFSFKDFFLSLQPPFRPSPCRPRRPSLHQVSLHSAIYRYLSSKLASALSVFAASFVHASLIRTGSSVYSACAACRKSSQFSIKTIATATSSE